ncbi:hypothetical protein Tco_1499326 [Tanacetum coccineum]
MEILPVSSSNSTAVEPKIADGNTVDKGSMTKDSKVQDESMKEQDYNEDKDQEHSSLNDKSNLTDLMKEWAAVAILRTRVEVVQEPIYQWIEGRSLEAEAKLRVVDANITEGSGKTSEIIRKLYEIEENRSLMREHFEEADILARTLRLEITKSKEKLNTREQLHLFQLTQACMDGGLLGSLLVDKMRQQVIS